MLNQFTRLIAAASTIAASLPAAYEGTDAAHAFEYAEAWNDGDDGSISGNPDVFGQWFLGGEGEHLIGDSTQVADGLGADINQQGKAFRLRSTDGNEADAFRFIDPVGLAPGQRFSVDLAVNYRGGSKGLVARGDYPENPTLFRFEIGADDYRVSGAATGNGSISEYYANRTAFTVQFTQTSESGGRWEIRRRGELRETDSGIFRGVLRSIRFYNSGQGGTLEDDLYFNNLKVETPE